MASLDEKVDAVILEINSLHDACSRTNWAQINRQGFTFELEQCLSRSKSIYLKLDETNREIKLLLEKGAPSLDEFLSEAARELTVIEANLSMEKKKKLRQELVNEHEAEEVPELYSSLQQKIISLSLKMRYNADKERNFLIARKSPFVKRASASKNLLEALQKKEDELNEMQAKNIELKRKTYFGLVLEKSVAEMEQELHEMDKRLSESVASTKKSLKTHLAQINYVEGSFAELSKQVEDIEAVHAGFVEKSVELLRELKKETDFARKLALEIEHETMEKRSAYTKELLSLEEKKVAIEEKLKEKYEKDVLEMKKQLEEKNIALKNAHKLIERLEDEVKGKSK